MAAIGEVKNHGLKTRNWQPLREGCHKRPLDGSPGYVERGTAISVISMHALKTNDCSQRFPERARPDFLRILGSDELVRDAIVIVWVSGRGSLFPEIGPRVCGVLGWLCRTPHFLFPLALLLPFHQDIKAYSHVPHQKQLRQAACMHFFLYWMIPNHPYFSIQ